MDSATPNTLVTNKGVVVLPPEIELNCAVTVVFAVRLKEQVPVPAQVLPLQPAKVLPKAGVAVSVIRAPIGSVSVQLLPQLIASPADRTTVPAPDPTFAIEIVACGVWVNVAATLLAVFIVTVQEGVVPEQAPLHPLNV